MCGVIHTIFILNQKVRVESLNIKLFFVEKDLNFQTQYSTNCFTGQINVTKHLTVGPVQI